MTTNTFTSESNSLTKRPRVTIVTKVSSSNRVKARRIHLSDYKARRVLEQGFFAHRLRLIK